MLKRKQTLLEIPGYALKITCYKSQSQKGILLALCFYTNTILHFLTLATTALVNIFPQQPLKNKRNRDK